MKTIILLALLASAAPAAAASYIDSTSGFVTSGTGALYNGTSFSFKPLNFGKSVSVGGIVGGTFSGHYGAKVTASIGAKLKFKGGVSFSNALTEVSGGNLNTFAGNPFGSARDAFYLTPTFSGSKTTTSVGKGQVDAYLDATVYAGANIHGKACLVFCKEGDLASIDVGKPDPYHILGYHSATNSVSFLDQAYDNVLPQDFHSDTVPITAHLEAINVSGTATGKSGTSFHTSQQFAGAYVDVAQAVVDAFGLPQSVLSGSVLGFDYTTISAKVGAGINALYDVATGVDRYVIYHLSSPVEAYNDGTRKWINIGTQISLPGEKTVLLRPVGDAASLSILPEVVVYTSSTATLTLNATLEDHIKLLEVSGYGISAGPLYDPPAGVVELGTIGTYSATTSTLAETALAPLTLDFTKPAGKAAFAFADASDAVPLDGTRGFVFVPDAGATRAGDTVAGRIMLATNYGTRGCAGDALFACVFDRHFKPIAEQQRTTLDVTGAPVVTYATDFATVDAVDSLPDGAFGTQSTAASMRALLARLPGAGGYDLPPDIADNSTPFMPGVPEPATWTMLVGGFGLVGAMRRRTRMVAA